LHPSSYLLSKELRWCRSLCSFPTRRSSDLKWFPHHVPIHIFKDYKLPKTIDFLFIGAQAPHVYPLRVKMIEQLKNEKGFVMYGRSEEHTSELQSRENLVCRLLLEKKKKSVC